MKTVSVLNQTRSTVLCQQCGIADNLFTRVRGLLGRKAMNDSEGLWITPCPSIHMFGMKFALDVVFVTRENIVTDWVENIAPGKMYMAKDKQGKPHAAIELAVGAIARSQTQLGDQLVCEVSRTPL